MPKEISARPNLEQYKRQAKELLRAVKAGDSSALKRLTPLAQSHSKFAGKLPADFRLNDAQWVLAREHGFPSWSAMKAQIAALNAIASAGDVDAFVRAAVWEGAGGNFEKARDLLALRPALAGANFYCACVTGEAETVRHLLAGEPELARRKGGPLDWEPILYVCFSAFLARQSRRGEGERFVAIAKQLLEAGADANSAFIGSPQFGSPRETALYGASGIANHAGLTETLLKAGADPQDGNPDDGGAETIYHTAEFSDLACMKLLFQYGVSQKAKDYCLRRQLDFENVGGTRLFLDSGANPNAGADKGHGTALHHAILRGRGLEVIRLLVERGGDLMARDKDGKTPFAFATRLGRVETASFLAEQGADPALSPEDRFVGACARADATGIAAAVDRDPDLVSRLSESDQKVLSLAARENRLDAARAMLNAGLNITILDSGQTPLHWAAWFGHPAMVELLLEYGAPLEIANNYGGTPLGTAVYASRHCHEATRPEEGRRSPVDDGNNTEHENRYLQVVHRLIAAGAVVHPWMLGLGTAAVEKVVARHLPRQPEQVSE